MNPRSFFGELKRRNVYKVAVAYGVVSWLVIQISSTVLPTFHAPEWVLQTLLVLVALGFPIVLVLAWAFELTPEGIKRTGEVARDLRSSGSANRRARPRHRCYPETALDPVLWPNDSPTSAHSGSASARSNVRSGAQ